MIDDGERDKTPRVYPQASTTIRKNEGLYRADFNEGTQRRSAISNRPISYSFETMMASDPVFAVFG